MCNTLQTHRALLRLAETRDRAAAELGYEDDLGNLV